MSTRTLLIHHTQLSKKPGSYDNVFREWLPGNEAGSMFRTPKGIILHGSRSTQNYNTEQEYQGTLRYVRNGAGGFGWHASVGDYKICYHMPFHRWGHNAREHSLEYIAVELAQANEGDPISDGEIIAAAAVYHDALATWPALPMFFPYHSELPAGIRDGKTDVEPRGLHSVRDRVLAAL